MNIVSRGLRRIARRFGYSLVRCRPDSGLPLDFHEDAVQTIAAVGPFTMISPERLHSLIQSVTYVSEGAIPGAVVECGVWRGGAMMAVARTLVAAGDVSRDLYLYDTFAGMPAPGEADISRSGVAAGSKFSRRATGDDSSDWCLASLDDVRRNMESTGYPMERVHLIQGKVEDTIPRSAPDEVALLRLDTDWYESTRHELIHLYPRLSDQGVLIIDDYGDWLGARKAVDEYFAAREPKVLLNRVDNTARLVVKPAGRQAA